MKEKQSPFSPTNCWAEWKAVLISQGQRALHSQKPLALVEAAKFSGSRVLSTAPPPSISMGSYFLSHSLSEGLARGFCPQLWGSGCPWEEERMLQMDGPGFHAHTPLLLFYWGFITCKVEQKVSGTIRL